MPTDIPTAKDLLSAAEKVKRIDAIDAELSRAEKAYKESIAALTTEREGLVSDVAELTGRNSSPTTIAPRGVVTEQAILDALDASGKPMKRGQIADALGVEPAKKVAPVLNRMKTAGILKVEGNTGAAVWSRA